MSQTQPIAALDAELNQQILAGKALEAFEAFYDEEVVMEEPSGRREGKAKNREYELAFFSSVKEFHGARLASSAVHGEVGFSEWVWDVTFADGNRVRMEQVAVRRWKDGKVVHERFYYNT